MVARMAKQALLGVALAYLHVTLAQSSAKCTRTFNPISAASFVSNMNPGWNLGNTLDAVETEGDWNNPPVVPSAFDDIKAAGFKGIRLPVTWAYHFTTESPTWTVDPVWLERVSDVVDMITSRGFHTIVNVHHDSWIWADITLPDANITQIEERFYRLWYQIGTKLGCKGSLLAFEPINEPPGTTAEHGAQQNKMNDIFLQAINDAGGFNADRVVTLVGSGEDGVKTSQWFERPDEKFKNPWAIQYHYYSPYDYIFSAWGKTIWGSETDKSTLDTELSLVRSNFTDIPLLIGEWAASPVATETAARWKYFDFFLRTAAKYDTPTILWDNGADFLNRASHKWRDEVTLDILQHVARGEKNALPDSTTDANAATQQSSAYIYHELNSNFTDVTLPFLFNGNSLESAAITTTKLVEDKDYTVDASASPETIIFKRSFLKRIIERDTSPATGSIANVTLRFTAGTNLLVNILSYSTPIIKETSYTLPPSPTALSDLLIPITWAGQNRPATVQAVKSDDTFLVDDWTQWLGPLQQGRTTYGGQWDWNGENVVLKAAVLEEVRRAGMTTTFLIEFYPRVEGNSVEFTVVVE